jgi:hypothetical protein
MNLEENKRVGIVEHLRRKNIQAGPQLSNGGRAVSIPAFGLCSYVAVYCAQNDLIPEAATALVELPGVDFVIFRDDRTVMLKSARGYAEIDRREPNAYRYISRGGDPLALQSAIGALKQEQKLDENGFADASDWFAKTNRHRYPNVVVNLHNSLFTTRVKHTADILVSLHDGYYYGWAPFGRFVRLAATHGNALAGSSNAFLMSTHRNFAECVNADNAKPLLTKS